MPTKQRKSDRKKSAKPIDIDIDDVTIATEDDEAEHPAAPILREAIDLQMQLWRSGLTPVQLYMLKQQSEVFTRVFQLLRKLANPPHIDHPAAPLLDQLEEIEEQQREIRRKILAIIQSENIGNKGIGGRR